MPDEYKIFELFLKAIKSNAAAYMYAKEKHLAPLFELKHLPIKHNTYALYLEVVKQYPYILQYVPEEHNTYALYLEVVKQYPYILQYVPEEHKTLELCLIAVKADKDMFCGIAYKNRTYELCLFIVKHGEDWLDQVPAEHRTFELCLIAVKACAGALCNVPGELYNPKILTHFKLFYKDAIPFASVGRDVPKDIVDDDVGDRWIMFNFIEDGTDDKDYFVLDSEESVDFVKNYLSEGKTYEIHMHTATQRLQQIRILDLNAKLGFFLTKEVDLTFLTKENNVKYIPNYITQYLTLFLEQAGMLNLKLVNKQFCKAISTIDLKNITDGKAYSIDNEREFTAEIIVNSKQINTHPIKVILKEVGVEDSDNESAVGSEESTNLSGDYSDSVG